MSHEISSVQSIDDRETFAEHARNIIQGLQDIGHDKVRCMMGIVVAESPSNKDKDEVYTFILGGDDDIAKMLTLLVTVTRNGIVQANMPSNHDDEVKH